MVQFGRVRELEDMAALAARVHVQVLDHGIHFLVFARKKVACRD